MKYSIFSLARNALTGHQNWQPAWRSPDPKPHYDVIIVGGGGHGLSTAYYLAKVHGITNVAVLEKGYLGSGNIGRNTTNLPATSGRQSGTADLRVDANGWHSGHERSTVRCNGYSAAVHRTRAYR